MPQVSTACILLFGKRPQNFFPRARLRFINSYGTEAKAGRAMNVITDVTLEGRILDRLVHTSVRFELPGASLRQKKVSNQTENREND